MGMSVDEYEFQKHHGRFRILTVDDAKEAGVEGAEEYDGYDLVSLLIEFADDKPVRIVGSDGGSPEDQSLLRDWSWVAAEMNQLTAGFKP